MQVLNIDNTLLVDSRDLATELNVVHRYWLSNVVRKYQSEVEQAFGQLRFDQTSVINSMGAVNNTTYVLFTEDQASIYMTMSQNNPRVIIAKINLVKAFSEAKRLLLETHHADKVKNLDWRQERTDLKSVHMIFQNACMSFKFPAAKIHDYITLRLTGLDAEQARLLPLIEGEKIIGLNHQPSPEQLARIAQVKLIFGTLKRRKNETYLAMVERAIVKAFPN